MSALIERERRGAVAHIVLTHPPVNALSQGVRRELLAAILEADGDASVRAISLTSAPAQKSAPALT